MSDNSRKFPQEFDNPIDNIIIDVGTKFFPFLKKMNFTANHLTTMSLILGLLSVFALYKKSFIVSSLLYFGSYCYDVLDGNYARKYKMVSQFGDYYDHIKDLIVNLLLFVVFIKYNTVKPKYLYILCIITIILFITMNLHLGCQEIYVSKNSPNNKSLYLNFLTKLCNENIIKNTHLLRYFGCGTFATWISIIILFNN